MALRCMRTPCIATNLRCMLRHASAPACDMRTTRFSSERPRGPVHTTIPAGDSKPRAVCLDCGYIAYKNPLPVVGAVAVTAGPSPRILLARRAIEPRKGFWGLPAGYMECGETLADGAAREVFEETDTRIKDLSLLAVYTVARISQIHFWFLATIDETHVAASAPADAPERFFGRGEESEEVRLFPASAVPWSVLAFTSGERALRHWMAHWGRDAPVDTGDIK